MADILDQQVDPKILGPLMSALIQQRFQDQAREQDPMRQLQRQALQAELEQNQAKQALVNQARSRLGLPSAAGPQPAARGGQVSGGLPGDGPGGPDAPITYGRNPRTGTPTFNNLGWVGDTGALPDNQQRVAQRLNNEAIISRQPPPQPGPMEPKAMQSIAQMAMDLNLAGVPGAVQDLILEKMFGPKPLPAGQMTDQERLAAQAQAAETTAQRGFVRDMLKSNAQVIDPKKYQLAQEAVAAALDAGQDPNAIAQSFGFNYMGDSTSKVGGALSYLTGTRSGNIQLQPTGSPLQQILRNAQGLPEAMQQVLGMVPGASRGAAPGATQQERVVVTKDGKEFSLPVGQLKEAEKQGYQLKK